VKTNKLRDDKRDTQKNKITDLKNEEGKESCKKLPEEISTEE
jgi:hypothetical protein